MAGFFSRLFGGLSQQEIEQRLFPVMYMAMVDGDLAPEEAALLNVHLAELGISAERAAQMMSSGKIPALPTKEEHRVEVLVTAALMMVADGKVAPVELQLFVTLALAMGFPASEATAFLNLAAENARNWHPGVDMHAQLTNAALMIKRELQR